MTLPDTIKAIQRAVGQAADGVFGPVTAAAVWRSLTQGDDAAESPALLTMDDRSEKTLATLDPKAQPMFREFYHLANATAATFGCSYILIGGNRTWEEQDALYAQGRSAGGEIVTMAKGGQSNHNFGIAADFGVFAGKAYLDNSNPAKAAMVHKACSIHAEACGLEWGGSWKSITDLPHYEVVTGLTMAQKRNVFKVRGSVL